QDGERLAADCKGVRHRLRGDEVQVVRRGVVLGVTGVRGPGERAHAEIEPGRAELPLVVAVWSELVDLVRAFGCGQYVPHHPVDLRVAAPALLVRQLAPVPG